MANEQNLRPFTAQNQPLNRGRKKGSLNFSTILIKSLQDYAETGEKVDENLVKKLCRSNRRSDVLSKIFRSPSSVMQKVQIQIKGKTNENE